jgi:glycosyltransferase involved in cell wall biosynthesis
MFPQRHFSEYSILVINQSIDNRELASQFESIKVINSSETGLSKSRNLGLKNATKPLIILTDDDVVFADNFADTIISSFNGNPENDVLKFQVQTIEKHFFKNYNHNFIKKLSLLELLNTMSIELVFQKRVLIENNVFYDEKFGLGATFGLGEENTLLLDLKKAKAIIGYIPEVICYHEELNSSKSMDKEQLYYNSGAFFYRNFGAKFRFWVVSKLFFDLKQRKISFTILSKLYKQAIKGKNEYKRISN